MRVLTEQGLYYFLARSDKLLAFVVKDVLWVLGYASPSIGHLIKHIPEEWKGRNRIATLGGEQEMWVLTLIELTSQVAT